MKPFFSLVIPYHNDFDSIGRLIQSIVVSKRAPLYEIIIVDDGSERKLTADSLQLSAKKYHSLKRMVNIIHLLRNKGPAAARNRGASQAKGKFVVFLDSDVVLFPDTLANLAKIYTDDPDIVAVTGVWVKEQRTKAFFPNFKALRDWSYWINERDKSGYYFLFSTRIASIKKTVFARLGGFDETYPGALVEDIELTYRIARRYAIIFAPNVRVRHEFESFWPIAKKYFLRAYYWTKLYARRKKFDPVATTWQEAITTISGVGTVFFGLTSILLLPMFPAVSACLPAGEVGQRISVSGSVINISCYYPLFTFYFLLFALFVHLFLVRKFLVFLYKEKGFAFALKGFLVGLVLYCFIFAGALWGKFSVDHTGKG